MGDARLSLEGGGGRQFDEGDEEGMVYSSTWVLASADRSRLPKGRAVRAEADFPCWTDDYCNLFRILR